jgi:hypothetical protein
MPISKADVKITFIVLLLAVDGLAISIVSEAIRGSGMPYNAQPAELSILKTKVLFARPAGGKTVDVYEIQTDGSGLKRLYTTNAQQWLNQAAVNAVFANMGTFDGYTKSGGKKVWLRGAITGQKLILRDDGKQVVLKQSRGLFSRLGITAFKFMPDGRHLLIETNHIMPPTPRQQLGILDTKTRKHAYLADGEMPVVSPKSQ